MKKIRPFIDTDIVKVLTGIRRCGKSVMLELIKQELLQRGIAENRFISINFESKAVSYVKNLDATYEYIKSLTINCTEKMYLFLDEIQELTGWEQVVNSCMIDFDIDIYITGSNAKMLSRELATYLGGRYIEIKMYPFSFKEVLDVYYQTGKSMSEADLFKQYINLGGMPFLYQYSFDETASKQYLSDIFDSIILKDIAARNKVRDLELLKRMLIYMIANVGNTFSANTIMKYLKNEKRSISSETLYNYIEYCKSACLLHLVSREDVMGKKLLSFQEKIYLTDHGIRESIYGNNERDVNQILENIIYMELLRKGYTVTIGKSGTLEVDFVAKKGNERIYVQVAFLLATDETIEREFSVLETIHDNFPKYVVTMDEFNRSRNGIRHVNIRRFLLEELV